MRNLSAYAQELKYAADIPLRHYRDDFGLKAGIILELADGRWTAPKIETREVRASGGTEHLRRLHGKPIGNKTARTRPPEFMAVITGVSNYTRKVEDSLYIIPITTLGA